MKQEPMPEHPAQLILKAVAAHERQLGIGRLALLLKGSKDKRVLAEFNTSPFYGALFYHPSDVIENFIKQLIDLGWLQSRDLHVADFPLPVLELTPVGREALEREADVALSVIHAPKEPALNETIKATLFCFEKVKDISELARLRGLAESTIWNHLIDAVRLRRLKAADIIGADKAAMIQEQMELSKAERLRELKELLPDDVSYEEIRCVMAEWDAWQSSGNDEIRCSPEEC